jgi:Flagellar assembly protein FliH
VRGDTDFAAALVPWMVQNDAADEPEPPRAMPSWMAPASGASVSPIPPYGDRSFATSLVPQVRSALAPVAPPPASTRGHAHLPAPAAGRAQVEPSLAPPASVSWGQVGSLPSLRPMMSIRPTFAPESGEVAVLRASLDAALAASAKVRQEILESSERDLVDLALVVAARVVGRELKSDPALVASWVREGVAGLVAEDDVSVTVSPDVAEALGAGAGVGYRLSIDPTLGPLSCIVRGRYGRVDVGAEARLRLLAEALGAPEAP